MSTRRLGIVLLCLAAIGVGLIFLAHMTFAGMYVVLGILAIAGAILVLAGS